MSSDILSEIEKSIAHGTEESQLLSSELSELNRSIISLRSSPTNFELAQIITQLEKEIEQLKHRIEEGKTSKMGNEEVQYTNKVLESQVALWRKRKRSALAVVDSISEGSGKSINSLLIDIGIDNDENYNVSLSSAMSLLPSEKTRQSRRK